MRDSSFTRHYISVPLPVSLGPSLLPSCPNKVSKFHVCASSPLCEMFIRPSLGVCVCVCVCVLERSATVHKWACLCACAKFCTQNSILQQAVYGHLQCFDNILRSWFILETLKITRINFYYIVIVWGSRLTSLWGLLWCFCILFYCSLTWLLACYCCTELIRAIASILKNTEVMSPNSTCDCYVPHQFNCSLVLSLEMPSPHCQDIILGEKKKISLLYFIIYNISCFFI